MCGSIPSWLGAFFLRYVFVVPCHGQMVDRLDQGILPSEVALKDYSALHKVREKFSLRGNTGEAHETGDRK